MKIQNAMKETGKAVHRDSEDCYIQLDNDGRPEWVHSESCEDDLVTVPQLSHILDSNWQPYLPKEEIRPKEAGELWEWEDRLVFICETRSDKRLEIKWFHGGTNAMVDTMIHNQNGWKRLHPPVPEENEIVIEGVRWYQDGDGDGDMMPSCENYLFLESLASKPPMTMKLTWPKE